MTSGRCELERTVVKRLSVRDDTNRGLAGIDAVFLPISPARWRLPVDARNDRPRREKLAGRNGDHRLRTVGGSLDEFILLGATAGKCGEQDTKKWNPQPVAVRCSGSIDIRND